MCWGCGSRNHIYATKNNIVCPNKDVKGVKEKAEKVHNAFDQHHCNKNKKGKWNKAMKVKEG